MDATGTATTVFYIYGSTQALGGIMVMCIPLVQRCLKKYETRDCGYADLQIEVIPDESSSLDSKA